MKLFHGFGLFTLLISLWICGETFAAKQSRHSGSKEGGSKKSAPRKKKTPSEPVAMDSTSEQAWRKKLPWIYRDSALAVYRESFFRPLFKRQNLAPEKLFRRGDFLEIVFPRGMPLHEYAYAVESICVAKGIRVVGGQEFNSPKEVVEYILEADSAAPLNLRLALSKAVKAGSARMAIVLVSMESVDEKAAERLLASPFPLTFSVDAGGSTPVARHWKTLPPGKEILIELPMEPTNYPYLKPGPGALFIHHSRSEAEGLMQKRMKACPPAAGFATKYGDRAIQNRPLLEVIFHFSKNHSLIFLDLTGSPRSLTSQVALQTGAMAFSARIQEPDSGERFETGFLRRCEKASKTGEGIWVLRYFPSLPRLLEQTLIKNQNHSNELGLEWVPLSGLRDKRATAP